MKRIFNSLFLWLNIVPVGVGLLFLLFVRPEVELNGLEASRFSVFVIGYLVGSAVDHVGISILALFKDISEFLDGRKL